MSFKLSLDDVEAWKGGGLILGRGTHRIKCVDEEIDESGNHPVVKLQLVATGGEEAGGEIRDWIHVTEKTLGRIAQIYKGFKVDVPSGEFEWIPLKGRQASIFVDKAPRRDGELDSEGNVKLISEVKSYSPLSEDAEAVERVAKEFGATEVAGKSGGVEEDIPF